MNQIWQKISLVGLDKSEEFEKREVVLLNKLTFLSALIMLLLIPAEVVLHGWGLVPLELGVTALCLLTFIFNAFKLFDLAKFYFFFVVIGIIIFMGVFAASNEVVDLFMFPMFIYPAVIFRKTYKIILLSGLAFVIFLSIPTLRSVYQPFFPLPADIKEVFNYFFYASVFLIVFLSIFYFRNLNSRFEKLLFKKNEEINEKNKEIVDSINYAQRIQNAYLPPVDLLQRFFPESFLLFLPKDIVSGDFYWFYGRKGDSEYSREIFIVAADCTGHGVPGAIMSVICANALNDAVINQNLHDTGEIFDAVRKHIVHILKSHGQSQTKDGMDAVICKFNPDKNTVQYSGAQNPLWILRKDNTEIEVIKGDKQPIGAFDNAHAFTAHSIQLEKGDQLYFFSDGYQDQFGGEKGKKFKAANLKKLIISNRDKSMSAQKELLFKRFENWKGDLEQVDDVCVIGVRV